MNGVITARERGFALIDLTGASVQGLPAGSDIAAVYARHGHVVVLADTRIADALPPALPEETAPAVRVADGDGHALRRRLARWLAAMAGGMPPGAFAVEQRPSGAPVLKGSPFRISFSARTPLSLVALAGEPIGVDIETTTDADGIPWNMLREDERQALLAQPEARRGEAFTRLWAAKEAYAKALGLGFRLAPETLHIAENGAALYHGPMGEDHPAGAIAWHRHPRMNQVVMAVALLSSPPQSFMDSHLP